MRICLCVFEAPTGTPGMERHRYAPRVFASVLQRMGHEVLLVRDEVVPAHLVMLFGVENLQPGHAFTPLLAPGHRFVVVQDTNLLSVGFQTPSGQKRFTEVLLPFLRSAMLVWEPRPTQLAGLRAMGVKARPLPLLVDPQLGLHRHGDPSIDVLTFGLHEGVQDGRMAAIRSLGLNAVDLALDAGPFLDDALARARVLVVPVAGDATRDVDPFVLARMLSCGVPTVTTNPAVMGDARGAVVESNEADLPGVIAGVCADGEARTDAMAKLGGFLSTRSAQLTLRAEFEAVGLR